MAFIMVQKEYFNKEKTGNGYCVEFSGELNDDGNRDINVRVTKDTRLDIGDIIDILEGYAGTKLPSKMVVDIAHMYMQMFNTTNICDGPEVATEVIKQACYATKFMHIGLNNS